jgi:hypothetical protein
MTASTPPLPFMIVNSGTRWLPEPETFGSKPGRVCRPKAQTGQQPQSFGGRPIVCAPFRRVELFSIRFHFSSRECCVTDTTQSENRNGATLQTLFSGPRLLWFPHDTRLLDLGYHRRLALSFSPALDQDAAVPLP